MHTSSALQGPTVACIGRIQQWGRHLSNRWFTFQVSHHGGKYSVERVIALEEYIQKASTARVIFVCVCTPLPIALLLVLQEILPLQDPKDGSYANYGYWIRAVLVTGSTAHLIATQVHFLVDRVFISHSQRILIGFTVGVLFAAISMVIASTLVFPIPFIMISCHPLFFLLVISATRAIVGNQLLRDIAANRGQLTRFLCFFGTQSLMVLVYPTHQMLFTLAVNTTYELPIILLLPVSKFFTKYLLLLSTRHMQDLVPEEVIFTADFFNTLYVTTSMQRASSLTTIVSITAIDLCQTGIALYNLHHHTKHIVNHLHEKVGLCDINALPILTVELCRNPQHFTKQMLSGIAPHSSVQYHLSQSGTEIVDKLTRLSDNPTPAVKTSRSFRTQIVPFNATSPPTKAVDNNTKDQPLNNGERGDRRLELSKILQDSLETLFTSECHVLMEYVESLIPIMYTCFILMAVRLPNVRYYTNLEGITVDNANATVSSVFVYGLLEIASFGVLAVVMQRNCGINALYQLAFILETQMALVQSKLMAWILVTFVFRIVHSGVDFTFKFDWIGDK